MALVDDGRTLLVADVGNHAIRAIDLQSRSVSTLAGNGIQSSTYPPRPGIAPDVQLSSPWDLLADGDVLYIAMAGSHQLWTLDLSSARLDSFAGSGGESVLNGPRASAELAQPSGLAIGDAGRIYFADSESSSIRWADPGAEGEVGLLAGSANGLFDFGLVDGNGSDARFQHPLGVVHVDGLLFVADTYNSALRVIDLASGAVTTLAGGDQGWADGPEPRFSEPGGLSFASGYLYVADTNNHVIRRVDPATGEADTMVLYGIERFPYAGSDGGALIVTIDEVTAGPGPGQIVLDLALPAGYKLNDIAPLTIVWSVEGDAADFGDGRIVSIVEPALPLELPVTWSTGEATLRGEVTVYYCIEESSELCLVHQVVLEVPVVVTPGGPTSIEVGYQVPDPG
jgi:sugar lactone lactonase YvrE